MPSWSEILTEVDSYSNVGVELDKKRKEFFDKIHDITGRNVIAYYSGWLKKPDAPHVGIDDQDKNAFMTAVYKLDKTKGLDLILHTPGGDIAATERIYQGVYSTNFDVCRNNDVYGLQGNNYGGTIFFRADRSANGYICLSSCSR